MSLWAWSCWSCSRLQYLSLTYCFVRTSVDTFAQILYLRLKIFGSEVVFLIFVNCVPSGIALVMDRKDECTEKQQVTELSASVITPLQDFDGPLHFPLGFLLPP